eukprot:3935204-Rhodomonas_salina.3
MLGHRTAAARSVALEGAPRTPSNQLCPCLCPVAFESGPRSCSTVAPGRAGPCRRQQGRQDCLD